MSENKKEFPGISPASIKMDLILFKDDVLKDMRSVKFSLDEKYSNVEDFLNQKITQFELKINSFSKKISELSNLIITDNSIREKVESLNQFREEVKDIIFKRRAKFNEFETQINNDISRINNILTDSVIYPTLIGKSAKFKTFHEFIDYVIQEISVLVLFKDKSGLDLTPFKRKIDQSLEAFKIQMNNFSSKDYTINLIRQTEERINNLLKIYDDRLQDTRVENSHYSYGFQKKAEEMGKQLEIMQQLEKKLKEKLEILKNNDNFINHNSEINYIKNRIVKFEEILKELLSYHPSSKKNYMNEFEKKSSKIYSGVKQYIKGNLNADELTTMKKFSYEKSKTKVYDKSLSPPITSPFPSQDNITINTINEYQKRKTFNEDQFLTNNPTNINFNINIDKTFSRKSSFNLTKKIESLNKQDFINNNKNNNNVTFNKNLFFRRNTYNFANIKSEQSSLNNEKINNFNDIKKDLNNENNINISKNLKDKDQNNSLMNIKEEKNEENKESNTERELKNDEQYTISEEDENNVSDNSCKNLGIISGKNKIQNKKDRIAEKNIDDKEKKNINANSIINNEEENINFENNKKKLMINSNSNNSNNLENNNIEIISSKRRDDSVKLNEKLIIIFDDNKNKINSQKKNDINLLKQFNENKKKASSIESNNKKDIIYNSINKSNQNNNSYEKKEKSLKMPINKSKLFKCNTPKYSQSPNNINLETKQKLIRNKEQMNYNLKSNNSNTEPIMINKTYTCFPKINQDLLGYKIMKNNQFFGSNMNILGKTLNAAKLSNKETLKIYPYAKKPKKVLLTNPDNIPPNSIIRKKIKNCNKNNAILIKSEKSVETKKIEKLFHKIHLSNQLNSYDEEKYKSLKYKRVNKSP